LRSAHDKLEERKRSAKQQRTVLKFQAFRLSVKAGRESQISQTAGTFSRFARRSFLANGGDIVMGFGRGALLWLLGVPLPIILLLAFFWHH